MPRGVNPRDEALLQARLWTPAANRSAIRLWLDADRPDSLTITSGAVSQWNDLSGRGLHASQGTAGSRPTWNGIGGGIRFDPSGGDEFLVGNALWSGAAEEFTIGIVNDRQGFGAYTALQLSGQFDWVGRLQLKHHWVGFVEWDVGNISAPNRVSAAFDPPTNTPEVYTAVSSVAQSTQYFSANGAVVASDTSGHSVTNIGMYGVGSNTNASGVNQGNPSNGRFFEIVFAFDTSPVFVRRLEGYLAWKWAHLGCVRRLAASHPFKNQPPLI